MLCGSHSTRDIAPALSPNPLPFIPQVTALWIAHTHICQCAGRTLGLLPTCRGKGEKGHFSSTILKATMDLSKHGYPLCLHLWGQTSHLLGKC